jgi:cell division septation protein DedD
VAIGSAILIAGCAGRTPPGAETQAAPPPPSSTPAPASAPAPAPPAAGSATTDFGTLPPPPPPPDPNPPAGAVATGEGWVTPAPASQTPGYRVQIFASSDRARAESAAADARQRFVEPVYIEFEAPLYKVRVGDCATRHEADTLKEKAGTQGYDGAWVAETPIQSH